MYDFNSQSDSLQINDLWERGVGELRSELDPQIFSAYIEPLKLESYNRKRCTVHVIAPSKFVCNQLDRNYKGHITRILSEQFGLSDLSVRFSVDHAEHEEDGERRASGSPYVVVKKLRVSGDGDDSQKGDDFVTNLNPKYTFESFVVGNSNQFCHAASMQVAEQPGTGYNPLFIYGGVGLGKTHLMHAIGNAALEQRPEARVLYISSETFTNELIQSLRFGKMDAFKNRLRSIDILLIDDIQFICGKERTQEEFFHTFNALYSAKHQIVITSDKVPQEIPGIEERLQTRFSWGLTADLQSPDFETRVAILKRKATLDSFYLPEDVSHYIAENVSSNVRELEGALTRLHALSSLQKLPMSLELAESSLRPILRPKKIHVGIDDIKRVVAGHFHIKISEMVSKRRTKNLSFPRHIAMYLCRKHTTSSYPEIGAHFGGRDHSSVIHAANVVTTKVRDSEDVREHIKEIEGALFSS